MPNAEWQRELTFLHARFPTAAALGRYLSLPYKTVERWAHSTDTPDEHNQAWIIERAKTLRREHQAGLDATIAARQSLRSIIKQPTLEEARAQARRCLDQIDERILPRIQAIQDAS